MVLGLLNRTPRILPANYFFFGIVVGLFIGVFIISQIKKDAYLDLRYHSENSVSNINYDIAIPQHDEIDHNKLVDSSLADKLSNEVKIMCWIMTGPQNHETKAKHVKATWGKRCNYLLFMSTKEDPSLPSIALPVIENRDNLWGKTKEAFKYVYKHYYEKADWFFKADDDTYTIVENMRHMLHFHNTSDPVYFGFRFKPIVKQGYMSGGSGYVLSKEALRRFIKESLPDPNKCKEANTGAEDAEIGKCLEAVGVEPGDSRDNYGRHTFLPLFADSFMIPGQLPKKFWFWSYIYYPFKEGMECCSDNLITVHYVKPEHMYLLEYLIYHVKPYGLSYNSTLSGVTFNARNQRQNENKTLTWEDYIDEN